MTLAQNVGHANTWSVYKQADGFYRWSVTVSGKSENGCCPTRERAEHEACAALERLKAKATLRMTGYRDEILIPVDVDAVFRDPALTRLEDGPAKAFLLALGHELERARGDGPEALLIVRRA